MATSEEFLKRVVEERGFATQEKIHELIGGMAGAEAAPFATLLVKDGLIPEQ